ncbi:MULTISPECIES: hypothetical protein [Halorussus]|uniref:hypothetical protein n=1 Tax=Halorussus TaxID=1070314 RepID=UPI000E218EDD|nr:MULTISPECIES: hypothetical protein [Halorussus]NHN59278.1 hypothetical protein [Halorussus sp. JP-T4]
MRENAPELGVGVRGADTESLPQGAAGAGTDPGDQLVLRVAVPVVNPQSTSGDSMVDGDAIVGRIPVANADTPCADDLLDAAAVTVLEERVTAYYPRDDEVVALVREAATDDWRCESWDADGEFELMSGRRDEGEAILWEPGE